MTSLLLCLALVAGLLQGLPVTAKAADSHGSDIGIGTTWFVGDKIDLGDSLYDQWFLARPDVKAYREIPHNTAAHLAVPFPTSAACRFLDLPLVNLRNLQLHLSKNSLAS